MKRQVFLLIGQSNMAGRGLLEEVDPICNPKLHMFRDGQWQDAVEPLHTDKPDVAGIGLAMSFADEVQHTLFPEEVVGLIPEAVGNTALARWESDGDLYARAIEVCNEALAGQVLAGILWHQGEADAGAMERASTYCDRLTCMLKTLREVLRAPEVPVVVGELGHFQMKREKPNLCHLVNEQLQLVARTAPRTACASAEGLTDNGDMVHFDSRSLREFGNRYAEAYLNLVR